VNPDEVAKAKLETSFSTVADSQAGHTTASDQARTYFSKAMPQLPQRYS
jgi:hypothetical protein